MRHMRFLLVFLLFVSGCNGGEKQPIEIGTVKWSRDLNKSLTAAKTSGKPVFLLFQEVPG